MYIAQEVLEKWLKEDIPYFDLTTHLILEKDYPSQIDFHVREKAILSGGEEVKRIAEMTGATVIYFTPSGATILPGDPFFSITGNFSILNQIAKVAQNIFEYGSGVATRTANMISAAKEVNAHIQILPTRKIYPGTKELAIKSILAGGAYPHRLGVSETILFFKQHIEYVGGFQQLPKVLADIRQRNIEKKIIMEVDTVEEAKLVGTLPVDGIQYDKFAVESLTSIVAAIKQINPHIIHLAAGGIHLGNVRDYARTGVDGIVTTAVYFGKPTNIGVTYRRL